MYIRMNGNIIIGNRIAGSHDDRVVPLHSYKLIATLQYAARAEDSPQLNPLLIRIETRAGIEDLAAISQLIVSCNALRAIHVI